MEKLKLSFLSFLLLLILCASIAESRLTSIVLAQSSAATQTPDSRGLLWLIICGGVGIIIGAVTAGCYFYFNYKPKIQKLEDKLKSSYNRCSQAEDDRKRLEAETINLKRKYITSENDYNDLKLEFDKFQSLNQKVLGTEDLDSTTNKSTVNYASQSLTTGVSPAFSPMEKLLQAYQANSKSLRVIAKVTEAPESIDQRLNHLSFIPNLIESGNFDYLIVQDEDNANRYWLLPKSSLKVNQYAYKTVQALFDCRNYQNQPSHFQLRKPASVIRNPASSSWQLAEKGEIEFI